MMESDLATIPLRGTLDPEDSSNTSEFTLSIRSSLVFMFILQCSDYDVILIIYLLMRPLSPIRSPSPLNKPKITFNYPPSPLKERTPNINPALSPLASPKVDTVPRIFEEPLGETEKCRICQKQATYREVSESSRYCSNCAIIQMRRGTTLTRIELKDQPFYKNYHFKTDKENQGKYTGRSTSLHNVWTEARGDEHLSQGSVSKLVRQGEVLEEELQQLLVRLQNKEFASEGIKAIYRQKKIGLKNHYQRIKASIKISIEKDLAELEKREKCSLECLESIKNDISSGVSSLQQIPNNLHSTPHSQLPDRLEESSSLISCMKDKQKTAQQIVSQLAAFEQGQEAGSDSLQVQLTQQQIELARNELYDPNVYTLLWGRSKKSQTLFSFEKKNNP